jgi:uncharacterized protein (TIGR02271 family)
MSSDPDPQASSGLSNDDAESRDARASSSQSAPDLEMTRSAERLQIGLDRRESRRARLTKFVETEEKTFAFPVRREQVRIEYLTVAESSVGRSPATDGPPVDGGQWLVLYHEEIVVETRWVPRERVRLVTRAVAEDRQVSADLRREEFELDDTTHGG